MFVSESITASFGVTKNLGDFNNVKLDASYTTYLREGEDITEAYERAWEEVESQLAKKLEEYTADATS